MDAFQQGSISARRRVSMEAFQYRDVSVWSLLSMAVSAERHFSPEAFQNGGVQYGGASGWNDLSLETLQYDNVLVWWHFSIWTEGCTHGM